MVIELLHFVHAGEYRHRIHAQKGRRVCPVDVALPVVLPVRRPRRLLGADDWSAPAYLEKGEEGLAVLARNSEVHDTTIKLLTQRVLQLNQPGSLTGRKSFGSNPPMFAAHHVRTVMPSEGKVRESQWL